MQKRSCGFDWVARLLAIVIALKAYSSPDSRFIVGTPWSKLCCTEASASTCAIASERQH